MKTDSASRNPAFHTWPWRCSAAAIPLLAYLSAFGPGKALFPESGTRIPLEQSTLIFLTLFGTGNAMLVGMSIGDLGRTIAGMLVASVAAMLCAPFLDHVLALIVGPVIMTVAWSACMATEPTALCIFGTMATVWAAHCTGLLIGALVSLIIGAVVFGLGLLIQKGASILMVTSYQGHLAVPILLLAGNLVFAGILFRLILRVQNPHPLPKT